MTAGFADLAGHCAKLCHRPEAYSDAFLSLLNKEQNRFV